MTLNFDDEISEFDVTLRPAEKVMRLSRLGSFHQSRLSFLRILLRRISAYNGNFQERFLKLAMTVPARQYIHTNFQGEPIH